MAGEPVELSGWLVDESSGLFLLGDHFPERYDYEYKIKIANPNIMHQILRRVPTLGGGHSLLFYKTRIRGVITERGEVLVNQIAVESRRDSDEFDAIDISDKFIARLVGEFGEYEFQTGRKAAGDWLNDID